MAALAELRVVRNRVPLKTPYHLSFGTLDAFETFIVSVSADGRCGYGEVTPLPGYSAETPDAITAALRTMENGAALQACIDAHMPATPMLASGLMCALETWSLGEEEAFSAPVPKPVPLVALVDGATREALQTHVRDMVRREFKSFKMKAGIYPPEEEAARARAALDVLPGDAQLSLDANQALDFERAARLCDGLAGSRVAWLEQPFADVDWETHAALIRSVAVPVLLDESVWTERDVLRAHDIGAAGVKLKLCKHKGMEETRKLMRLAQSLDMILVFGNGVQTALGNHLEAVLHVQGGLPTASEGNGFLKVADVEMSAGLSEEQGCLIDRGFAGLGALLDGGEEVFRLPVTLP